MSKKGFQKLECLNLLSRRTDDSVLAVLKEVGPVIIGFGCLRFVEAGYFEKLSCPSSWVFFWDFQESQAYVC